MNSYTPNTYTVIAIYPGAAIEGRVGTCVHSVQASSPAVAAAHVAKDMATSRHWRDVAILAVFEGAHQDVFEPLAYQPLTDA